jgi:hypothetical protein
MNTITLTQKETLEFHSQGEYGVAVQMVINNGSEDVIVKDIYFQYDTNTMTLEEAKALFLQKVKDYWDKYQRIIAEPKLDDIPAAINEVRELAETYINE